MTVTAVSSPEMKSSSQVAPVTKSGLFCVQRSAEPGKSPLAGAILFGCPESVETDSDV